jgi:hypothetical protein
MLRSAFILDGTDRIQWTSTIIYGPVWLVDASSETAIGTNWSQIPHANTVLCTDVYIYTPVIPQRMQKISMSHPKAWWREKKILYLHAAFRSVCPISRQVRALWINSSGTGVDNTVYSIQNTVIILFLHWIGRPFGNLLGQMSPFVEKRTTTIIGASYRL